MRRWWCVDICFSIIASVLILLTFGVCSVCTVSEPVTMNLALFRYIPEYEKFENTVLQCWQSEHPDVELNIVDWDCYFSDGIPEDVDVFVFDTLMLDAYLDKGYLLPLHEDNIDNYDDLIPAFVDGCRDGDDKLIAVPQIICTDVLYTRKSDDELKDIDRVTELTGMLADRDLLMDINYDDERICLYLQVLTDDEQRYIVSYPPIEDGKLSESAVDIMKDIGSVRLTDTDKANNTDDYYYARRFGEGTGRAFIGYTEAMNVMGDSASEMHYRLISMADDNDVPVFYVDAAAINSHISNGKKELAYDLLNMITGQEMLIKASVSADKPLYVLTGRYSVYDTLASEYPIYAGLKEIVTVPDTKVFRIVPDGEEYLYRARENIDALPDI